MKKAFKIFCILLPVVLIIFLLTECSFANRDNTLSSGQLRYYKHRLLKTCYAADYTWASEDSQGVLDIPDRCEGYRVTALGGYSGCPCAFLVNLPGTAYMCSKDSLPDGAQVEQYHLTINIGKYLKEAVLVAMDDYHCIAPNRYVQILVTINCAPDNPHFYSENGKLYKRSDNSLVEDFFYSSDY